MQIVCVSRGTYVGGKQLAETLARKLGHDCLAREELADAATHAGIALGKVEVAVAKRRPFNEWLSIEKERYKAFVAATLSERVLKGGLVYHGRLAHLQLPGVSHVMRVRAIMDAEMRTGLTMQRLGVPRDKAKQYNEQVDEDRNRWAHILYGVDVADPGLYDVVLNLSHVGVDNAAAALVPMAQLPEFQPTPAGLRALRDILLAARCRLAIGNDPRTRLADVQVKASSGQVLVTFLPRQQRLAPLIQDVLARVEGIEELVCTLAATNLLWIQERFDATSDAFDQILDLAARWEAAVELVQLKEGGGDAVRPAESPEEVLLGVAEQATDKAGRGGILDDGVPVEAAYGDEGVNRSVARLVAAGRAGGYRRVSGGPKELLASLDRAASYSLVVVGDLFLGKAESVRKRLSNEMVSLLSEKLTTPVLGLDGLKERYTFGPRQWLRLLVAGAGSALMFALVFANQAEVLAFLSRTGTVQRALAAACLLGFVCLFAYLYGSFSRSFLRLLRFE